MPRKVDDDCLRELRWLYDRRYLAEATGRTCRPGSASGRRPIPSSAPGSRSTSRRRSPSTAAAPASQAPEVDQPPGAPERGDQVAHPRRPRLSQRGKLLAAGARARGRDARELARGASLPEHGRPARAQEGGPAHGGREQPPTCALWKTLRLAARAHHRHQDPFCRRFWTELPARAMLSQCIILDGRSRLAQVPGRGPRQDR